MSETETNPTDAGTQAEDADAAVCSYDEVPYPSSAFPQTHPRSLCTVARMLGVDAPDITTCRLLEIGCAAGDNLIPMAVQLPQARFVGIDLSSRQVADANARIAELGLTNIEIRQCDVRDAVADDLGEFDYVISHGVYSWVPREAANRIMGLASEVLSPNGIVYISYNTLPGWHMRGMIRDMMLHHVEDVPTMERVDKARSLLQFLASVNSPQRSAFGALLHNELRILQGTGDAYLFHEHLEPDNEPIYFQEFAARAAAAGLQYLTESQIAATAFVMHGIAPKVRATVEKFAGTLLEREQYLDFLRNRTFRQTVLCRAGLELDREMGPEKLQPFHLSCPHDPDSMPAQAKAQKTAEGEDGEATGASTEEVEAGASMLPDAGKTKASGAGGQGHARLAILSDPLVKGAMRALHEAWPASLGYDALLAAAEDKADRAVEDHSRELLPKRLLDLYLRGGIEASPVPWVAPPEPTDEAMLRVHPLTQIEAEGSHKDLVTNQRHKPLRLTGFEKKLVSVLDGAHTRAQLVDSISESIESGDLALSPADMTQVAEREAREGIELLVDRSLKRLYNRHILVGAE